MSGCRFSSHEGSGGWLYQTLREGGSSACRRHTSRPADVDLLSLLHWNTECSVSIVVRPADYVSALPSLQSDLSTVRREMGQRRRSPGRNPRIGKRQKEIRRSEEIVDSLMEWEAFFGDASIDICT